MLLAAASTSPAAPWFSGWPPLFYCAFAVGQQREQAVSPALCFSKCGSPTYDPSITWGLSLKCRFQAPTPRISGVWPRNLHFDKQPRYVSRTLKSEAQGWEGRWRTGSSHTTSHWKPLQKRLCP